MTLPVLDTAEYPCTLCGVLVHRGPDPGRDEWAWLDVNGNVVGLDRDFAHLPGGPYVRLAELDAAMTALRKADPKWRDPANENTNDRLIKEYIALKVRVEFGGTLHEHRAESAPPIGARLPDVSHCDYPAYRRPSGWQCRVCFAVLGDDAAVGWHLDGGTPGETRAGVSRESAGQEGGTR